MRELEFNVKVTCKHDKCLFFAGAGIECKSCSEVVIFEVYHNSELVEKIRSML